MSKIIFLGHNSEKNMKIVYIKKRQNYIHIKQFWNCSVDTKQLSLRQHADFFRTATISDGKRLIRAQKG